MRAADLRLKIRDNLDTLNLPFNVPPESLLEDVNAALHIIPTGTMTETNKLMYTTAAVILEMLGYEMNYMRSSKGQH